MQENYGQENHTIDFRTGESANKNRIKTKKTIFKTQII